MPKTEGIKAFNENVRNLDESLANAKLRGVEVDRAARSVVYKFVCDRTVDASVRGKVVDYCLEITPRSLLSVEAQFVKIAADEEIIAHRIYDFVTDRYPSLAIGFGLPDVAVEKHGAEFYYTLAMPASSCEYCRRNRTLEKISAELDGNFCGTFVGALKEKAAPTVELKPSVVRAADLQTVQKRTLTVGDVTVIDDPEAPTVALYIDDAVQQGEVTLCGRITSIRKKEAVNGKPFYVIELNDGTGKIVGVYFTRRNTADKIARLAENDEIIVRGKLDYYKEKLSLTINKINLCRLPENFVPERRAGNAAPLEYTLVFPQPAEQIKVTTLFDVAEALPQCLTANKFVVFDLETTGKIAEADEITEIGAVSIVGGRIAETFQTLVKPTQSISAEITALTGIDDALVKDAPSFGEVLPDFYRFAQGAILVAHNSDFDCKFMKLHANPFNYYFDNRVVDTLALARSVLPQLSDHKLNTVAAHFNVEFRHHRALSDAYATAEIFIEMTKMKKSLTFS